jgi:membrane fusion protein (multidrug efflux system)
MNAPAEPLVAAEIAPDEAVPNGQAARKRKPLFAALAAFIIAALGVGWLLMPRTAESTDNAYLQADSSTIAPRVGGLVARVLTHDNQTVQAGEPLIVIDPQDFAARVAAAEAEVADAEANVAAARAALVSLSSERSLAAAQRRATSTSIEAAEAEYSRAAADSARYEELGRRGFATRRDIERLDAATVNAAAALRRARADTGVAGEQAAVVGAKAPVLSANLAQAEAAVQKARAALKLARQEQGYTVVTAPFEGTIGNRQVQVGDFVQPGSRLLTLVPRDGLYVVANFKETQTRKMRVGQRVRIEVDALNGGELNGTVESFAPGSGSEFTLLPFEPGSGNFTKIVQRIPVRIRLDRGQAAVATLRPGLSVTATVKLQ